MNELVSIIIPVYKVENYIEKCLDSVINQTYKNIEIILIDDGSPDRSGEICDEYAQKDSRIVVIHKKNEGVSVARNTGILNSRGEFITFIDPDDYVESNYVNTLYTLCVDNNVDVSFCGIQDENEEGKVIKRTKKILNYNMDKKETIKQLINNKVIYCTCWGKMFKKSLFSKISFKKGIKIGEDFDVVFRILKNIDKSSIDTRMCLYHYIVRKNSATKIANSVEDRKYEIALSEEVLEYVNACYPDINNIAIKRYFLVVFGCIIIFSKTSSDISLDYFMNKLKKYKYSILTNKDISIKWKFFYIVCLINPRILKEIFDFRNKWRKV